MIFCSIQTNNSRFFTLPFSKLTFHKRNFNGHTIDQYSKKLTKKKQNHIHFQQT